jgi:cation:H+ antiporter
MPDFAQLSLTTNLLTLAVAAAAVWAAGTRISQYADALSEKTKLGTAFIGVLLLGGVTSLPEVAVSFSSAQAGNVALAVNNLLGGVSMQVAVLAAADFFVRGRALTAVIPDPIVLLQGALNVLLLSIVVAGTVIGDSPFLGIGLWSWAILAFGLYSLRKLARTQHRKPWLANIDSGAKRSPEPRKKGERGDRWAAEQSLARLIGKIVIAGMVIFAAGYVVGRTGEAIAQITGLGSSFVGAALVATSTSLPEVSTVFAAVRLGLYTLAISDILGTNLFDIILLFGIDAIAPGQPALNRVGAFSTFAATLGIMITATFLMGVAERRDRTVLGIGVDSATALVIYGAGLFALYTLR